jgi:hypothetical protein
MDRLMRLRWATCGKDRQSLKRIGITRGFQLSIAESEGQIVGSGLYCRGGGGMVLTHYIIT